MNLKRIALGIATTVFLWVIASNLIPLLNFPIPAAVQSFLMTLISVGVGAFIARRGFLIPAFALLALYWACAIYLLYLVAAPTGQASFLGILLTNASALTLQAFATMIGVVGGQLLGQRASVKTAAT